MVLMQSGTGTMRWLQNSHDYIDSLGLDNDGQEGYVTVAPRDDITLELHSALMGNNSYAGDIPGDTPAYTNDIVVRNVLYSALIYANPGRDTTTSQMMNFPDGGSWKTNDGKTDSSLFQSSSEKMRLVHISEPMMDTVSGSLTSNE